MDCTGMRSLRRSFIVLEIVCLRIHGQSFAGRFEPTQQATGACEKLEIEAVFAGYPFGWRPGVPLRGLPQEDQDEE